VGHYFARVGIESAIMVIIVVIFDLAFFAAPYGMRIVSTQADHPYQYIYSFIRQFLWLFFAFYLSFLFVDSLYVKLQLYDRAPTPYNFIDRDTTDKDN